MAWMKALQVHQVISAITATMSALTVRARMSGREDFAHARGRGGGRGRRPSFRLLDEGAHDEGDRGGQQSEHQHVAPGHGRVVEEPVARDLAR